MQDIQEIFNRIQKNKSRQKDLKQTYTDALVSSFEYQEIQEKLKTIREKKKQLEHTITEQFSHELVELEDIKIDIASDMELISDIAMTKMMKGETIEVTDEYDNEYEPIFTVKFKKAK